MRPVSPKPGNFSSGEGLQGWAKRPDNLRMRGKLTIDNLFPPSTFVSGEASI